jgi:hypothetical protein
MSFKLFLCRLGFHKWLYYKREFNSKDSFYNEDFMQIMHCRRCVKCEKIEESHFGHTWNDKFRCF